MPDRVIATKRARALVEKTTAALPPLGNTIQGFGIVEGILNEFRLAYGGSWVGGRATLDPDRRRPTQPASDGRTCSTVGWSRPTSSMTTVSPTTTGEP